MKSTTGKRALRVIKNFIIGTLIVMALCACASMKPRPTWVTSRWHACEDLIAEKTCGYQPHQERPFVGPEGVALPDQVNFEPLPKRGVETESCLDDLASEYLELEMKDQGAWLQEQGCPADVHERYGPLQKIGFR